MDRRIFAAGYDHGNSTTTAVIYLNGREQVISFPSATFNGNLKSVVKARKARGDETIRTDYQALRTDEHVFEQDGSSVFVGKLALSPGYHPSTGIGDINRYGAKRNLECLLTAAASIIPDTHFDLLVVTGLPYKAFDEKIKKDVRKILNGTHVFKLNGRERVVYVKVGKILMEGAGATLLHEIDEADEKIHGVIDIGGYSTDIYASHGLQPLDRYCGGIDVGVEKAVSKIKTWFEDTYGFTLAEHNKDRIVTAYLNKSSYPSLKADEVTIPLRETERQTVQAFEEVARQITEFLGITWHRGQLGKVASDFDDIEIIGGGPYFFKDYIRQLIPAAVIPYEPEYANARGYAWFAHELLKQREAVAIS